MENREEIALDLILPIGRCLRDIGSDEGYLKFCHLFWGILLVGLIPYLMHTLPGECIETVGSTHIFKSSPSTLA